MKSCPQCQRVYSDETLNYCLEDGASLVGNPDIHNSETAFLTPSISSSDAKTRSIEAEKNARITEAAPQVKGYRSAFLAVGILLVAAVGIAGYWFYGSKSTGQISAIAVLPFENDSGDPELDYLSDGVSESVIDRLSQLSQLKVIARSSSFQYRGANLNLKDVANALGVEALVTGRVVQRGDSYSIHVEMIDAKDNRDLWSDSFVRKATDVQTLQSDISREIAENLRLRLSGAQTEQLANAGTANPAAYEMLLKGRYYSNKVMTENRIKAAEYFQRAIDIDPNYALAYAELALTYTNLVGFSNYDPKEYMPKAEAAAQKAFELGREVPEAVYAMATLRKYQWQWAEAEQLHKHAIELNPNLARAHNGYALFLSILGRHDEAIAEIKRARELDPISMLINGNMGLIYYQARRYDEAISVESELDQSIPITHLALGQSYSEKGMNDRAIAEIKEAAKLEMSPSSQIRLAIAYARAGDEESGRNILKRVKESKIYVSPSQLAMLYAVLGDKESALSSLEAAYQARDVQLQFIKIAQPYDSLRSDPRFQDLLKRVGLP